MQCERTIIFIVCCVCVSNTHSVYFLYTFPLSFKLPILWLYVCIWQNYWFLRATLLLIGILAQFPIEIIHKIFKIYYQHCSCVFMYLGASKQANSYQRSLISNAHSSSTLSLIKKTPTTHVCHTQVDRIQVISKNIFWKNMFFRRCCCWLLPLLNNQKKMSLSENMNTHFPLENSKSPECINRPYGIEHNQSFNIFALFPCQTICNAWKTIFKSTLKSSISKVHFCLRLWF